jgi:hypothetical protein
MWWRYALAQIVERENIKTRIYHTSFATLVNEEKYKICYIKKCLDERILTKQEIKFIEKFEIESELTNIIKVRNVALD